MKKFLAMLLAVCMLLAVTAVAESAEYKLGLGVVVDLESSDDELAQVDATFAAVVTDAEGKIVACYIDTVQNKMEIEDGEVDTEAEFKTKREKGDDYGMVAYGNSIAEWYAQADAFEAYVIGKTVAEVEGIETAENDKGYNVAVDETLLAGCTIDITDFVAAVVKACNDEKAQTFTGAAFTLGAAAISTSEESTDATDDEDAAVKMYSEFGAAVVADGKIICAITDAIQPVLNFDIDSEWTDESFKGTKRELGADYGMVAYGNAIAEWDAQAQAFANFTVGKTADEVKAIETTENDHGYAVAVDETLYAGCTMQITGMMEVIAQAAVNAR